MADNSFKDYKVISMGTRFDASSGSSFHIHDYTELIYFSKGNGTYVCGDTEFAFSQNMLICIPPRTSHAEFTETEFSNVYFLTDANIDYGGKPVIYDDSLDHEMECLITQLRQHYFRRMGNYKEICSLIIKLMIELVNSKKSIDDTDAFVDKAISIVFENFTNPEFDINRIYDDIPLSKVYFATLFKKVTGMSPLEHLNFVRIENAKSMLLSRSVSTNCSVSEISMLSGFNDPAYFSRIFKKHTGASPLNWLKEQKI